jgi:hypothetical protein
MAPEIIKHVPTLTDEPASSAACLMVAGGALTARSVAVAGPVLAVASVGCVGCVNPRGADSGLGAQPVSRTGASLTMGNR